MHTETQIGLKMVRQEKAQDKFVLTIVKNDQASVVIYVITLTLADARATKVALLHAFKKAATTRE